MTRVSGKGEQDEGKLTGYRGELPTIAPVTPAFESSARLSIRTSSEGAQARRMMPAIRPTCGDSDSSRNTRDSQKVSESSVPANSTNASTSESLLSCEKFDLMRLSTALNTPSSVFAERAPDFFDLDVIACETAQSRTADRSASAKQHDEQTPHSPRWKR